jgi:hypothetical protein
VCPRLLLGAILERVAGAPSGANFCAIGREPPSYRGMQKLKLLMCAALIAAPFVAYADAVDCSSTSRWNSDKNYKKGDRVWYHGFSSEYQLYSCDKDQCHGAGSHEPGGGDWKFVGHCDKTPS